MTLGIIATTLIICQTQNVQVCKAIAPILNAFTDKYSEICCASTQNVHLRCKIQQDKMDK